jgi:hypothetical protein
VRPKHTKPDRNQGEIVSELERLGYSCDIICDLPGLFDILVCKGDRCLRVEVKAPGGKLTQSEKDYQSRLKHPETYLVAHSTADILRWFCGQWTKGH